MCPDMKMLWDLVAPDLLNLVVWTQVASSVLGFVGGFVVRSMFKDCPEVRDAN